LGFGFWVCVCCMVSLSFCVVFSPPSSMLLHPRRVASSNAYTASSFMLPRWLAACLFEGSLASIVSYSFFVCSLYTRLTTSCFPENLPSFRNVLC
jgi:hypothetical protein